ncbi:MAG: nucleotidyltransferase family protein [Defluviitaleaceae bacterium]|nr:nucleotidyltransferase family protein [Defluviitaleaceae bacterium]
MKSLGIIVEYNPFHNGHSSHLANSKEINGCKKVVAIMSGNFVQRGEPAICDKWQRTKMALQAGIDLVIELPLYYATSSAGYFAKGAVTLLDKLGFIDCMCFGSEWANIDTLKECAQAISKEDEDFKNNIYKYLKLGLSYPAARAKAIESFLPNLYGFPDAPNNILGIEYIKALLELNSNIEPTTVLRSPGSAKDIRADIKKEKNALSNMPSYSWDILKDSLSIYGAADIDYLSPILQYILKTGSAKEIQSFVDVSEVLANRIIKCAKNNGLISEILLAAKNKSYTYLRLQRAVLHIILGITHDNLLAYESAGGPQYIRVLGFRKESADILKLLEKRAMLPVITNLKNIKDANLSPLAVQMLEEELNSTKLYSMAFSKHVNFNEHVMPLVIV